MNNLNSLAFFWPELILSVTILAAVVADLFYQKKDSHKVAYWSIGGLILAYIAIRLQSTVPVSLFMDTVALDPFSQFFKVLILLSSCYCYVD
jgi:NADH:ubiquinone oxidoreductase subunit 2 (chain N)